MSTRAGRLLLFLDKVINFGRELAHTLRQGLSPRELYPIALCFGTADVIMILRRITEGLRLAGMLETRLEAQIACEQNAPPAADAAARREARADAKPTVRRPRTPDPRLAELPSAREIADDLGRRPSWVVISEICRKAALLVMGEAPDPAPTAMTVGAAATPTAKMRTAGRKVGLMPEHGELWQEMLKIISENGGGTARIFMRSFTRLMEPPDDLPADWWVAYATQVVSEATGPP